MDSHEPAFGPEMARHYLRDLVYGANDGIITTFAVISGVAGASLQSRTAVILGMANLLADGFSMGASNFLSIRSEEAVLAMRKEPAREPFPLRHGLATFLAFVLAGSIPLLPYAIGMGAHGFTVGAGITLLALFTVGSLRALITNLHWLRAGMEMLMVGALAAGVSYGVGSWIALLT
jgi:VIT1/CCC1 family predicted Fe2+/Mn2+ transporter